MELTQCREEVSRLADQALMERIQAGEEAALDVLLKRYWTPLVRYALGFVRRQDEAEDIVQEGFIRVWVSRQRWCPAGSVKSYVYTIVRNLCLHQRDRSRVRDEWATIEQRRLRCCPTPSELFEEAEVLRVLEEAIQRLPERRREVFRLACLHGFSYQEVADAMGVAVPTVANQMSSALAEIRQALQPVSDCRI